MLCGCLSNAPLPPERPVAYMYPSAIHAEMLSLLKPVAAGESQLDELLRLLGVKVDLVKFGLTPQELETVSRGLRRRGYAELDCRRTKCPVRMVIFFSLDGRHVNVKALHDDGRETLQTIPDGGAIN